MVVSIIRFHSRVFRSFQACESSLLTSNAITLTMLFPLSAEFLCEPHSQFIIGRLRTTHHWPQVPPPDGFADNVVIEESWEFISKRLVPYGTNFKSPDLDILSSVEGH